MPNIPKECYVYDFNGTLICHERSVSKAANLLKIDRGSFSESIRKGKTFLDKYVGSFRELQKEEVINIVNNCFKPLLTDYDEIKNPLLKQIYANYSEDELRILAKGSTSPRPHKKERLNFLGKRIRIGVISDTHIGSKYTNYNRIYAAFEEFRKQRVDLLFHCGDVTEGMSSRAGHAFELSELGYEQQKNKAIEIFSQWDGKSYFIDGNHDRWYIKGGNAGANIVKNICRELEYLGKDCIYLGHDEGDIELKFPNIIARLWHGEDGSSYALSYRLQKIVESLEGGDKPNILIAGHSHKQGYFSIRNIQTVQAGCIQQQSKWMRGKRIAAHTGFWILDITVNRDGVTKFTTTWYPYYSKFELEELLDI